jgi:hypothetical protein
VIFLAKVLKADGDIIIGDSITITDPLVDILISWQAYENIALEQINIFHKQDSVLSFDPATAENVVGDALNGYKIFSLPELEIGNHYIRAVAKTKNFKNDLGNNEIYQAYTNPVWFSVVELDCDKNVNESGSLNKGQWMHFGPFDAGSGDFSVEMSGSGDADLYLKKGSQPTSDSYDCRPYKNGSVESCQVNGPGLFYLSVYGYKESTFSLSIVYEKEGCSTTTVPPACETITKSESGSLNKSEWKHIGPFDASDADFSVEMTGSGDADLYVKKGSQPTSESYDCRPYKNGSTETCSLRGPGEFYISIYGYSTESTYNLSISYENCTSTTVPPAPSCDFDLSKTSLTVSSEGASDSITVTAENGCEWQGTGSAAWIEIISGSSGSGNGIISLSFPANPETSSRTGTLTIAGEIVIITQEGSVSSGTGINLSLEAGADAKENYQGYPAENINDGDSGSVWYSESLSSNETVWVQLSWDEEQIFSTIKIDWSGNYYAQSADVWVHQDGNWDKKGTYSLTGSEQWEKDFNYTGKSLWILLKNGNSNYFGIKELTVN